jgi:lipoprotein signal peptidase
VRRRALLTVAVALASTDLVQKAREPVYGHPRGVVYVLVAAGVTVFLVALVPRVPSLALSLAAGVGAAGALGNLLSALIWRNGVPNPIVAGDVAFNVADVCAVAGAASLVVGATIFALRNPTLLREPI